MLDFKLWYRETHYSNAVDTETDSEQLATAKYQKVNPHSSSLLFLTRCQNML